MQLRTKLALAVVLSLVLVAGILFGSIELFKQQAVTETQTEVDRSARLTAEELEGNLQRQAETVQFYAAQEPANLSTANSTLRQFVGESRFFAGQVIAPDGSIVAYQDEFASPAEQATLVGAQRDEPFIRQALTGEPAFRPPERTANSQFDLWVAHPIRDPKTGTVYGVLTGVITIETSGLLDVQAGDPADDEQVVTVRADTVAGEEAVLRGERRPFTEPISSSALTGQTEWVVTVSRDRGPLNDRLETLQLLQAGGLGFIVVIFAGIGYYEYRTNVAQTQRLLAGFESLTAGEYDETVSLSAAEEWRQIGDGFNEMATSIKEREQTIQEREQVLSVLTRLIRHNVQNDLTIVQGNVEVVPELPEDRQQQLIDRSLSATEKLLSHAEKAKQLNAAVEGAEEGLIEADLTATVTRACKQYQREYPDADITADVPDGTTAWALEQLGYAVETLIENAIEHNDSDRPEVAVSVTEDERSVSITIADNGPGIPEHEQEVLSLRAETDLEHGSGVGLWLAHVVAEKSGGQLRFGDQEDGGTVSIELARASVRKSTLDTTLGTLR